MKLIELQIYKNIMEGLLVDMDVVYCKKEIDLMGQGNVEGIKVNLYLFYNWYCDLDGLLVVFLYIDFGEIGENVFGKYYIGRGWVKEGYLYSGMFFL